MASEIENSNDFKTYTRTKIRKFFEKAQEQYTHQKLLEKCKILHKKCEDEDVFLNEFTNALRYVLVYPDKLAVDNILTFVSKYVILTYNSNSNQELSDSTVDECAPFIKGVFKFIFENHGASSADARLKCMQLLSKILCTLPENSLISDEMWQKLKDTVLCRMQDKNLNVRTQAVLTARMLQDPKNSKCEVIKALLFHFNDPSPSVRRGVVSSIALNKVTIGHLLARTRDVNDNVRRNAYLIFSKIKALNLTIKYRVTILERGLNDRSEMVQKCVEQILILNWFENFKRDILKFLEALDVVNCSEILTKTIESLLKTQPVEEIVKQLPIDEDTKLIPIEKMTPEGVLLWRTLANHFWSKGKEEELDNILPNLTTFCNHIREFYKLDNVLVVDLTNEDEQWNEVKEKEILCFLLEMIKIFDLSDEMGRIKLKELMIDMLISSKISNSQIKPIVEILVKVIPNKDSFIGELTEVISEIRQPLRTVPLQISEKEKMERNLKISDLKLTLNELREEEYKAVNDKEYAKAQKLKEEIEAAEAELKTYQDQPVTLTQEISEEKNDPITLCKCLSILVEIIRSSRVTTLTPQLLNLKENFLSQCMSSRDLLTQSLAIEASAQFCILDKELAKENLIRFLLMISEDGDNEIVIPSLKTVFDILQTHGIESLDQIELNECKEEVEVEIEEIYANESRSRSRILKNRNKNFRRDSLLDEDFPMYENHNKSFTDIKCLKHLNALLCCKKNDALKSVAYEGFCKLLITGVIYSPSILSRIIIKGFSPIIDCESEDFIRQTFMVFFPFFAANVPRSQEMIEAAFIPTLKSILSAPLGSPDADINPKDVIAFLIDHTKADINKFTDATLHVHNNFALSICHEILGEISDSVDNSIIVHIYLKALNQLELSLKNEAFHQQLQTITNKIEKKLKETSHIKTMLNFKKRINSKLETFVVPSIQNTLSSANAKTSISSKQGDSTLKRNSFFSSSLRRSKRLMSTTNVIEDSSISESNESSSSPGQVEKIVVPESPDRSE